MDYKSIPAYTIKPSRIKVRDRMLTALINGVTKSGVHKDVKREKNKNGSREWKLDRDNGEW